jgi:hypothetical protein
MGDLQQKFSDLETKIHLLEEFSREWCDFATKGDVGRLVTDPVYQRIVEGRDKGPKYSSCGDLAHWLLFILGVREPWVNRDENKGWRSGFNVNLLIAKPIGGNPIAENNPDLDLLHTGDIIISWKQKTGTDAHVMVFDHIENGELYTWDLGQGPMSQDAWKGQQQHLEARKRRRILKDVSIKSALMLHKAVPSDWETKVLLPTGEAFDYYESQLGLKREVGRP